MVDHSLDNLIFQLTEAHMQLNKIFFDGKLTPIKIIIETKRRSDSKVLAYFSPRSNQFHGDNYFISIITTRLNGQYEDIINTLIHEMIHQYCFENNIQDAYATNNRHNKAFRDVAISLGWIYKSPSELNETERYMRKLLGFAHADSYTEKYLNTINSLDIDKELVQNTIHADSEWKDENNIYKFNVYECEGCGNKLRSKNELNVLCLDCNVIYKVRKK